MRQDKIDYSTKVFMFSGGSTSAYMVAKYWQAGDLVVFADTGREHPLTYKFVDDFEVFTGIPILRTAYDSSSDPFGSLLSSKGYKVLPNLTRRFCTIELKIKPIKKLLKSLGVLSFTQVIGFRADEPDRVKKRVQPYLKVKDWFPLYDAGVVKADVEAYWKESPFRLEVPKILGNCTLCFMKGSNAIIRILSQYPELAEPWVIDEEMARHANSGRSHTYVNGISIAKLLQASKQIRSLPFDLNVVEASYSCSCS